MSTSTLTKRQRAKFGPKPISGWGKGATITAEVRYDDDCGNGHNTFSITGEIRVPGRRDIEAGGCLHEEIVKAFPELAPLIKWHLCSSDGPMHYHGNVVFLAGERDCWGKLAGEPRSWKRAVRFGANPITHPLRSDFATFLEGCHSSYDLEVLRIDHERERETFGPKFTYGGFAGRWHECPFDSEQAALEFLGALQTCAPRFLSIPVSFGTGKARELDAARACAIWPEATDEELTDPGLEQRLADRLPALLAEFRAAIESLGFTW